MTSAVVDADRTWETKLFMHCPNYTAEAKAIAEKRIALAESEGQGS